MTYSNTKSYNHSKHFRFRQSGKGPVIILIGGDVREWGQTVELLSSYFTVIIPSFAFNIIAKQKENNMVKYLELIVEELKLEKFSIIAHSLGALTAVLFADKNPHLVQSIILSNIPDLEIDNKQNFVNLMDELLDSKKPGKDFQIEFWFDIIKRQLRFLKYKSLNKSKEMNTLLVWGDKNPTQAATAVKNWEGFLQNQWSLKTFRHAGHFPMKDNPLYFSLVVKDFIENNLSEHNPYKIDRVY